MTTILYWLAGFWLLCFVLVLWLTITAPRIEEFDDDDDGRWF